MNKFGVLDIEDASDVPKAKKMFKMCFGPFQSAEIENHLLFKSISPVCWVSFGSKSLQFLPTTTVGAKNERNCIPSKKRSTTAGKIDRDESEKLLRTVESCKDPTVLPAALVQYVSSYVKSCSRKFRRRSTAGKMDVRAEPERFQKKKGAKNSSVGSLPSFYGT